MNFCLNEGLHSKDDSIGIITIFQTLDKSHIKLKSSNFPSKGTFTERAE